MVFVTFQAGLPDDRTKLVDESEAASTYIRNEPLKRIQISNENCKMKKNGYNYLLIDIGGN